MSTLVDFKQIKNWAKSILEYGITDLYIHGNTIRIGNEEITVASKDELDAAINAIKLELESRVSKNELDISSLKINVKESNDNSLYAVGRADRAYDKANSVLGVATEAFNKANESNANSIEAKNNSLVAISVSSSADSTSTEAKNISIESNKKSDDALSKSTIAITDSASAVVTSNEAKDIASNAETNSSNAVNISNVANTNSINAVNTSKTASETAVRAETTANNISGIAEEARDIANTANNTSSSANETAIRAETTANAISGIAEEARTTANAANATSSIANTNASSALEKANSVEGIANDAKSVADSANTAATDAQGKATEAQTTANAMDGRVTALENATVPTNKLEDKSVTHVKLSQDLQDKIADVDVNAADISALEAEQVTQNNSISANTSSIESLDASQAIQNSLIADLQASQGTQDGKISALESATVPTAKIQDYAVTKIKLAQDVQNSINQVATNTSNISSVSSTANSALSIANTNSTNITNLTNRVNALGSVPVGTILAHAGPSIPSGFLPCNGGWYNKSTYSTLFSIIGTYWGDGGVNFRVPDFNGRFLEGHNTTPAAYRGAGLPNITGYAFKGNDFTLDWEGSTSVNNSGAIKFVTYGRNATHVAAGIGPGDGLKGLEINAAWSNGIYGASSTVQPASATVIFIIKY